jgi:MacB-like periplasmic core domain
VSQRVPAAKLLAMTARAASRALWRNRLRSGLTMLGMIIGVAAVIAMVSVGAGADRFVQQQIASFGTNIVMVIPGAVTSGGARSGWGGASTLTVGDTEAVRRVPEVAAATHSRRQVLQTIYGNTNWSTSPPTSSASATGRSPTAASSPSGTRRAPPRWPCSARPSSATSSDRDRIRSAPSSASRTCRSRSSAS